MSPFQIQFSEYQRLSEFLPDAVVLHKYGNFVYLNQCAFQSLGIDKGEDSSLSYLKKLPIDTLKIDRSFIQDIPKDEDNMAITTSIISLGKHLKKKVVAEGVEEESQVQFLLHQGCDEYQGFYCSPPIDPESVELLFRS
jgi:sensor c-di-GMP phosphodiesterase-like protein